jgi:zinc transporter ZupT
MAGAIAMISVFVVVTIEMFFASRGAGHTHQSEWTKVPDETAPGGLGLTLPREEPQTNGNIALHGLASPGDLSVDGRLPKPHSPGNQSDDEDEDDLEALDALDAFDPIADESAILSNPTTHKHHRHDSHASRRSRNSLQLRAEDNPQKLFLQCLLLEAGILFHSIFIGMAVSVATGTAFVVLLLAICFHQTFEGFALGSRIAALIPALFDASSPKPWLMALAYGATTPIGQAIGIWMHRLYDPQSQVGLLMVGITNAISSGLLLFAGLVQLIAEDFLSDHSYESLKGKRRIEAALAVGLGGLLMAIVGAFA